MKISAQRSGDLAGRTEQIEIDTEREPNGKSIEALLGDIGFFTAAPPEHVGADIPLWRITVSDDRRTHSVSFAEDGSAASAPWQALLAQIRAAA